MKMQAGPHQSESFIYNNQQLDIAQIIIKVNKRCFTTGYIWQNYLSVSLIAVWISVKSFLLRERRQTQRYKREPPA